MLAQEPAPPALAASPEANVAPAANSPEDPPSERMDRVLVTGTNTERWLSEAPARSEVSTITPAGVEAAPKLAETLEWTTGLRVESTCQNCNSTEAQMLGLPQRYTAILTDGLPSFSSLSSIYRLEQLPTAFLDRIEVVKGGGSALSGPQRIAGGTGPVAGMNEYKAVPVALRRYEQRLHRSKSRQERLKQVPTMSMVEM